MSMYTLFSVEQKPSYATHEQAKQAFKDLLREKVSLELFVLFHSYLCVDMCVHVESPFKHLMGPRHEANCQ